MGTRVVSYEGCECCEDASGTIETDCCPDDLLLESLNIHVVGEIVESSGGTVVATKDYGVQSFEWTNLVSLGHFWTPDGSSSWGWWKEFENWDAGDTNPLRLAMKCGSDPYNAFALYHGDSPDGSPDSLRRFATGAADDCFPFSWSGTTLEMSNNVTYASVGGHTISPGAGYYVRWTIDVYE